MSLFDSLGNNAPAANRNAGQTPAQILQELKANPVAMLRQRGITIPDGMNNPQQIIQHLIQSGQIPQSRFQQMAQMMMRRK